MFKCSTILGFLFFAASCGRGKEEKVVKENAGHAVAKVQDSLFKPADTVNFNKKQEYNTNTANLSSALAQFVPTGYTVLDTTSGDLNLDQYADMIMVLRKNGEDTSSNVIEHPEKRPLLILLGQADNTYKLTARNDNAVYCIDCGGVMGDPFMDIAIKKGYFSVEHYGGSGWRWTRTITFRYSTADKNWYLYKDGGDSFHATDPEKVTSTVRTVKNFGKVPFEKFDIYKED